MDIHSEWKDFNRQLIAVFAVGILLAGSLYYFIATAYVNAGILNRLQWKGAHQEEIKGL